MRRALLIVFITLTGLAGCTTYHPEPITPDRLARQFEQRSLAGEKLHTFIARESGHDVTPWPPTTWNRRLLTLAAFYYNPTLDLARAQWNTARTGIGVADTSPNPILQLPFQHSTPNPGPGSPFTWGPSLDITIETAHKRRYRTDQATHLSEAARLNTIAAAWTVSSRVRNAMLALYAARTRTTLLSAKAQAKREITGMSRRRLAVGQYSQPDVDAAVLADTQAQSDLATAQSGENDAQAQLAAAIGVPVTAIEGITLDLSAFGTVPPPLPAKDAQRAAIFHRADLRASLADYAAAESALQLQIAKQYPDIHLGPGYTYDTGTEKIAFGLAGITLPIFDQNQQNIRQAEAKRSEAAVRTGALQDRIIGDLAHALTRYQSSIKALRLADTHQASARRQLDSQATAFSHGNTDRLTFTQAKVDYQTSEITHLDALVAVQHAAGALEDAMQQPLGQGAASLTSREGTTP
ncbi:MAG: TolC family protein [Castellaniella sp.]|uniref:TolC family protein n=1 Tax=Castellaniella sp. TaxID=1955812 RepID=UPI0012014A6A|nr:TolC family protein [Castellaniella sp.]TAN27178.1 MAG: TolC family protein [Castellaniella sp.]